MNMSVANIFPQKISNRSRGLGMKNDFFNTINGEIFYQKNSAIMIEKSFEIEREKISDTKKHNRESLDKDQKE
jgi:hypothetical protein